MKKKYIYQDQESGQTYPAMQEVRHTPSCEQYQDDISGKRGRACICEPVTHTPTPNEIINDISLIAIKWPKETREMVFRAVNAHEALLKIAKEYHDEKNCVKDWDECGCEMSKIIAQAEGK